MRWLGAADVNLEFPMITPTLIPHSQMNSGDAATLEPGSCPRCGR
jgi:hypothetical protein